MKPNRLWFFFYFFNFFDTFPFTLVLLSWYHTQGMNEERRLESSSWNRCYVKMCWRARVLLDQEEAG